MKFGIGLLVALLGVSFLTFYMFNVKRTINREVYETAYDTVYDY